MCTAVDAIDVQAMFVFGQGGAQGDVYASKEFMLSYQQNIGPWRDRMQHVNR